MHCGRASSEIRSVLRNEAWQNACACGPQWCRTAPPVEFGTVTLTQPCPEVPYESCAVAPQAARPPKRATTTTAVIAKIRFCRGERRPALGLVLAYIAAHEISFVCPWC